MSGGPLIQAIIVDDTFFYLCNLPYCLARCGFQGGVRKHLKVRRVASNTYTPLLRLHPDLFSLVNMSSTALDGPVGLPPDNLQPELQDTLHNNHLPANNVPSHPPPDGPSHDNSAEPPRVGMAYESMAAAKKHITEWCARERIPYSVWKADRRCWVLTCKDKNNCLFRLRVKNTERPIISILEAHTCSSLSFRRTAQTG